MSTAPDGLASDKPMPPYLSIAVVEAVPQPLLVLDVDLCVVASNDAFRTTFQLDSPDVRGRPFHEIADGQWEDANLHSALHALLEQRKPVIDYQIEHAAFVEAPRTTCVNARNVYREQANRRLLLVSIEDITQAQLVASSLATSKEQLRKLSVERVLAEEKERRRIATELHDSICQTLALAQINTARLLAMDPPGSDVELLRRTNEFLKKATRETRLVMFELSPNVLYDLGLVPALKSLAKLLEEDHALTVEIDDRSEGVTLTPAVGIIVFRSIRELLMNVIKHADADRATVRVAVEANELVVRVSDAGSGFEVHGIESDADVANGGFGLLSIADQLDGIGGRIDIDSQPDRGTNITIWVPLQLDHHFDSETFDAS